MVAEQKRKCSRIKLIIKTNFKFSKIKKKYLLTGIEHSENRFTGYFENEVSNVHPERHHILRVEWTFSL